MDDFDLAAGRAVVPSFYTAPYPLGSKWEPRPYQHAGVEYCLARNNALIGDEPGVGKTAQAILLSNAIGAKRTLVICPASLRLNWRREIWAWSTIPNVQVYCVMKNKDGVSLEHDYVVISYDMLRNPAILDALMQQRWDHMIVDEAHYFKDPKGNKRVKPICAPDCLPSVVGRITPLSGTIMPNQPRECYNVIRLLNWNAIDGASLDEFESTYYGYGEGWVTKKVGIDGNGKPIYKQQYSDKVRNVPQNLEDLQYRLRKHIMVRRLKVQLPDQLPAKQWHLFPLAVDAEMRKALQHPGWAIVEKMYDLDPSVFDKEAVIDGAVSTARRLLGEAKAPAVADYIDDLMNSGIQKLVVGAWHTSVLEYLRKELEHYGLAYMDAKAGMNKRQAEVDKFQGDDNCRIILGQKLIMGVGWTLTKAQDIVDAEYDWGPGNNDQFFDRIHRFGQTGQYAICHVPVVPGSPDERIVASAVEKSQNIFAAMDKPLYFPA